MAAFGMAKGAVRNLHVPLSGTLYDELAGEAARVGRPATTVAREAIEQHLKARRRAATDRAVLEFARKHAGTSVDFDATLEAASARHLFGLDDDER